MELKKLRCPTCGASVNGDMLDYAKKIGTCNSCLETFVIEQAEKFATVEVDKTKDVGIYRNRLTQAVNKDNADEIGRYAEKILDILPDDFDAAYFYSYAKAKKGDSRYIRDFYAEKDREYTEESAMRVADHVIRYGDFRDDEVIRSFLKNLKYDGENYLALYKDVLEKRLEREELYADVTRDVFICHRSTDRDIAERIVKELENDGNRCWASFRNLRPNDNENYWTNIKRAIKSCHVFLVVSGRDAMLSPDVKKEMLYAKDLNKLRLEIKIDDSIHNTSFKDFFDGCKWVNGENYDEIKTRVADLVAKAMRGDNGVIVRKVEKVKYAPIREAEQPTAKIVLDEFHKHEFVKGEVVPPTCKEPGFTVYRCECGEMKKSDFTARRTEHDFVLAEKKEPTCTDDGYVKYECKYCDATKTDAIPALGHDFKLKEVKDSTCIKKGYRFFTCGRCGEKKWEELPLIEHTFSDWKITKFPSCEEAGEETRQCSFCGKTESRALQPTGHNYGKWTTKKEPTCTENGIKVCRCQTCGKEEEKAIEAKGHTFGDWYTLPTDVTKDERICKECGYSETRLKAEVKEKKLHVWSWVLVVFSLACLVGMIICRSVFIFDGYYYLSALPITLGALAVVSAVALFIVYSRKKVANKLIKIGSVFLLVVTVGLTVGVGVHTAVTEKVDYYKQFFLAKTDNGYEIKRLRTNIDQIIEIPSEIKGKPVVSIADNAFYNCSSLTSITIPDSVTSIGESAFDDCSSLTSVTIGNSVTSIGSNAFNNCPIETATIPAIACSYVKNSNLKTVVITSGESIGYKAFENSSSLTSITIPDSVTRIGEEAFYNCICLTSITIGNSVTSIGNYAFYNCSSLTNVTIGNSVTSIGESAFYGCGSLTSITIPDSVTSIGESAFYGCGSLMSITIPDSVTSIGNSAFSSCSSLTSITICNGVTSIGDYAFNDCSSLTSVYYTGDIASWCGITFSSYYSNPLRYAHILYINNKLIQKIVIPDTVTEIKKYAFSGWNGTSITIPASVTSIGYRAFYECSRLTSITIPDSVTSIGDYAFYNCPIETATIPAIACSYVKNSHLKTVVITSGESIGEEAFYNCSSLTSVTIGNSVTSIGNNAFSNCPIETATIPTFAISYISKSNLKTVVITSGESIGNYAFSDCSNLTNITIPDSVTSIGESAFEDCSSLTSITIPDSVTGIGYRAFSGCSSLQSITIPFVGNRAGVTSSNTYQYPFGYIFGTSSYTGGTETTQYYYGSSTTGITYTTYYIPSTLKSVTVTGGYIPYGAFYNCSNLTSITLGNSVTSIGNYAFYGCSSLQYNEYDNGYYLGNDNNPYMLLVKAKDTSITSCTIHENTKFIHTSAFYDCSSLTSITLPDSVTSIGDRTFYNCSSLTSITIPDSVTSIGNSAFYYCSSLTSITIGDGVTSIGSEEFRGCSSLTSITIPDSVTSIRYEAFYNCSSLTSITIPDSVTSIGQSAFEGCSSLTSVTIGNSVTSIGNNAFSNCPIETATIPAIACSYVKNSNLKTVVITSGESIGYRAFYNCSSLTSVTIGNSVTSLQEGMLSGCSSLQSITIPFVGSRAGVTSSDTYQYPFGYIFGTSSYTGGTATKQYYYGSSTLSKTDTTYYIPSNLKSVTVTGGYIPYGAFSNCSSLTSITIGNGVTSIGNCAFSSCSSLTSITIPDSVTSIGSSAFYGCTATIAWGKNPAITTIGTYAFSGYNGTSITIPDSVTSIGYRAFSSCSRLTSITIPDSVTSIGDYAFYYCSSFTSIAIPDSVTSIGRGAFAGCYHLVEVYNKSSLNIEIGSEENGYVGYYAKAIYTEEYTSKLSTDSNGYIIYMDGEDKILIGYTGEEKELTLPEGITEINQGAFDGNNKITSVTIPDSVTSIGNFAFSNCSSLTSVYYTGDIASWCGITFSNYSSNPLRFAHNLYIDNKLIKDIVIPDTVTKIKDDAFQGWNGTSITIPDSVTSIGSYAFISCNSLTSITIPDSVTSIGNGVFYGCSSLKSITIPNSVTSIGDSAFEDCSNLTSITIPDSVTNIGYHAFYDCSNLTSITFQGTKAQWNAISKGSDWNYNTGNYTVHCKNGDIYK